MKKLTTRATSLLLACCLVFTACAAQNGEEPGEDAGQSTVQNISGLSLAYSSSAGFNPYLTASSLTHQLSHLLYCRLVTITPNFEIEYNLASNVEINSGSAAITINTGWNFTDGTAITAYDVAASMRAAKDSAGYGNALANIGEITATGATTLSVELLAPDSLFEYLLDFPIMKEGELATRTPTASGRYSVGTGEDGGECLIASTYYGGELPAQAITLVELGREDTLIGSLSIGDISFYASEQDSESTTSIANKTAYYKLNNLVFIGFNATGGGALSQPLLRQAVSAAVNRSLICEKAYFSRAYVASGLLNPAYPLSGGSVLPTTADTASAGELLTQAGYTTSTQNPYLVGADGQALVLRLLCPAGSTGKTYTANLIKEQLARAGIGVEVTVAESDEAYLAALAAGNFDMYIGEIKLYNNMDMRPFFTTDGGANYGIAASDALLGAWAAFRQDSARAEEFEQAFADEMPFAPLAYRCGIFSYNRTLDGVNPSLSDLFYEFDLLSKE